MTDPHGLPRKSETGFIQQGKVKSTITACADETGAWVELRRHYGQPWSLSPALARALASDLRNAADAADEMNK